MQVPAVLKQVFDTFPLATYNNNMPKNDEALKQELQHRTYAFQGAATAKKSVDNPRKLVVHNITTHNNTGAVLSADPWCLFAQLMFCKINSLKLPSSDTSKEPSRSNGAHDTIFVGSHYSSPHEKLPYLVYGSKTQSDRSSISLHKALTYDSASENSVEKMYIALLDTTLNDFYVSQLLFEISDHLLVQLYYPYYKKPSALFDWLVLRPIQLYLIERCDFSLRNMELALLMSSRFMGRKINPTPLTSKLQESGETVLLQFQDLLGSNDYIPTTTEDDQAKASENASPGLLDLKLASYIFCIGLLEGSPLKKFVDENCQQLQQHAERVIAAYV
ncbi:HCL385Wp [Eremothecium sinecaudum]|uniref:HCL385Wp n=1 Tax=Eremothecium sinecaudum TaxID=45286 RepID=A0A109UYA9_9SACH|nr:HCL385Wp [Eremothecium sinecaudum]AMD19766.1 HCL385Wp [Eremothecium sinecaudum]